MDKILSWLESFKSFFSSEVAKISSAQTELVTARAELATANATIAERDTKIVSLTADLEKAQNEVNTSGAKVKSLTEELAIEKGRATEAIAEQCLPADKLPEGEVTPGSKGESAFKVYERLTKEGKHSEAAKFYAANAEAVIKTRK